MKSILILVCALFCNLVVYAQKVKVLKPGTEPSTVLIFAPERIDTAEIVYVTKSGLKKGYIITTTSKCTYDYFEQSANETFTVRQSLTDDSFVTLKDGEWLAWRLLDRFRIRAVLDWDHPDSFRPLGVPNGSN